MKIRINDSALKSAAEEGPSQFLLLIGETILNAVGGELSAEALQRLTAPQITLSAYIILRRELLEGGFIQLIYNGYGPLFFHNPFAKALRQMGEEDLAKMIYDVRRLYDEKEKSLEKDLTEEEFMALYEQYPEFDPFDDTFVEEEPDYSIHLAHYVDKHINDFVELEGA